MTYEELRALYYKELDSASEPQRVLGRTALIEEVGAELPEVGNLPFVESLLRRNNHVRVLLGVAQRGRDFAALEDIAVHRESDL